MRRQHSGRMGQLMVLGLGATALAIGALCKRGQLTKPYELVSSACVLGAAVLPWWRDRGSDRVVITRPLVQGMACGLLGDLVMGRVLPLPERSYVPMGMLVFGAGHLAYIATFRALALRQGLWRGTVLAPSLFGMLVFASFAWQRWIRNDEQMLLSYAALAYAMLLATMAGSGLGLALQERQLMSLALGGMLFVGSDLLLGARILRNLDFPGRDNWIWLSYISGQALIVWGASSVWG